MQRSPAFFVAISGLAFALAFQPFSAAASDVKARQKALLSAVGLGSNWAAVRGRAKGVTTEPVLKGVPWDKRFTSVSFSGLPGVRGTCPTGFLVKGNLVVGVTPHPANYGDGLALYRAVTQAFGPPHEHDVNQFKVVSSHWSFGAFTIRVMDTSKLSGQGSAWDFEFLWTR